MANPTVIADEGTAWKSTSESRVYGIDYSTDLGTAVELTSAGTFTLDPADGRLTKDNEDLADDGRSVSVRLIGGKPGKTYVVKHVGATNESPPQIVAAWFHLFIKPEA